MKVKLLEPIEGFEQEAEYRAVEKGEIFINSQPNYLPIVNHSENIAGARIVLTPIKKVLDWDKISNGVHIRHDDGIGGLDILMAHNVFDDLPKNIKKLYSIPPSWIAHTLGDKCPVDPDACIVEATAWRRPHPHIDVGDVRIKCVAKDIPWGDVCQFRVTGLAEGYEYP